MLSEMSIEVTQLKAHVDKLSEDKKKIRCSIEKRDNKIDHLEQKLYEAEEELKLEGERCQEQQSQVMCFQRLSKRAIYTGVSRIIRVCLGFS